MNTPQMSRDRHRNTGPSKPARSTYVRRSSHAMLLVMVGVFVGTSTIVSTSHDVLAQPGRASTPTNASVPVLVIALDGAADAAWSLARLVYEEPALRPTLDDTRARILAGDPPPRDAEPRLRELSDLRAAVHGDDAPSRRILASIATELGAQAVVLVWPPSGSRPAEARLFVVKDNAFDAAILRPDPSSTPARPIDAVVVPSASASASSVMAGSSSSAASASSAVVRPATSSSAAPSASPSTAPPTPHDASESHATVAEVSWIQAMGLIRARLVPGSYVTVTNATTAPVSTSPPVGGSFLSSPWFWGALGVAVLGGAGVYLGTRNSSNTSSSTIELHGRVAR